jgi:aspartate aminotransferase-like enzyme
MSLIGNTPSKVNDGVYDSMMKRIVDIRSPNFTNLLADTCE